MSEQTDAQRLAKVGDFVEIVANTNEHGFDIGEVVVVGDWEEFEPEEQGLECVSVNGGDRWFVRHTDYRITSHPSEYERLRTQLDAANQTIAELNEDIVETNKTLSDMANDRDALHNRIDELWGQISEKDAEIERLCEELSRIEYLSRYYDAKLMCNGLRLDSIAAEFGQIARDALNKAVNA